MDRRRSLALTALGGTLLLAGVTLLVSTSHGRIGMPTTDEYGRTVTTMFRTPSVLQDSPRNAAAWLVLTLAVVLVLALVIRFGGVVGPVILLVLLPLVVLVTILTIGIFLAPGVACLSLASLLAVVERSQDAHTSHTAGSPVAPTMLE